MNDEPIRLREWRAYGPVVEIRHTRDLSPVTSEEAAVRRAVNAYVRALAAPEEANAGTEPQGVEASPDQIEQLATFMRPWLFGEAREVKFTTSERVATENLRDDARKHAALALDMARQMLAALPATSGGEECSAVDESAARVSDHADQDHGAPLEGGNADPS